MKCMTRQQMYNRNVQLQRIIYIIINACQVQNYDRVLRYFTIFTKNFMEILESVLADLAYYNQEIELVNVEGVTASLQSILAAQESKDYILLADLLELQMIPFLQSLQEAIRTYDGVGTEDEIWNRNMVALEKGNPELWNQLRAHHTSYEKGQQNGTWAGVHHLEFTNCGAFTMAGQDEKGMYYYHSNSNPHKEAIAFADYYYYVGQDAYVFWGLGLGYHIHAFFAKDDGVNITVFENDIDVIYHACMVMDFSVFLERGNLQIVYDPTFQKVIRQLDESTKSFIIHSPSLRHISDARIREQMEMFFMRDAGKRNVEVLFESNSRENFKNADGYVDDLKPHFEGKKVVVVAAGPSLDKNVELLKNKPEDVVVVATGTVFRKLITLGIDMDYVIVTDANRRVYKQMQGLEEYQIPLIYLSTAYKGFSINYKGKKYLICQDGYDKAEQLARENGWHLYQTGGSVSTTALDVCIYLGCKEIAFIGLDLAYTDNLAHATDTSRREAAEAEELKQIPAVNGGTVPASKVFQIYKRWMEERIKEEDVIMPVYDATEGGARIEGWKNVTLNEYLQ